MAVKEIPINVRQYYKSCKDTNKKKVDELNIVIENLNLRCKEIYNRILNNKQTYIDNCKVNLDDYQEFKENKYINGEFYKVAKGIFINRNNNYTLASDLYDLYLLASKQKDVYQVKKEFEVAKKLSEIKMFDYIKILNTFYTEVHRQLVVEGNGYSFGNNIGWICVNRCVLRKPKKHIDYKATKEKEKQLKAEGKRIYNKEEADWCKKNGIEYKAEDKRVFQDIEYCYEIPLIGCKLPNAHKLKLDIADYRHKDIRGKSNDVLMKECNGDINKICKLPIDLRSKVTLCDKSNKMLYTKFIRNEDQQPAYRTKAYRKD